MIVNLNTLAKVYLNEQGKMIWMSQIESLPEQLQQNTELIESIKNKVNPDGSLEIELWALMNLFGPYISMIESPFKTTTIEISRNPIFGKSVD